MKNSLTRFFLLNIALPSIMLRKYYRDIYKIICLFMTLQCGVKILWTWSFYPNLVSSNPDNPEIHHADKNCREHTCNAFVLPPQKFLLNKKNPVWTYIRFLWKYLLFFYVVCFFFVFDLANTLYVVEKFLISFYAMCY